jgi:hypothetical protein
MAGKTKKLKSAKTKKSHPRARMEMLNKIKRLFSLVGRGERCIGENILQNELKI